MNSTNKERRQRLINTIAVLSVSGIGRRRLQKLVKALGSVDAIETATIAKLSAIQGISRSIASALQSLDKKKATEYADRVDKLGWTYLFPDDPEYPKPLSQIDSAPPILFRLGLPYQPNEPMIAIVGTRHPTENGRLFASSLARALAESGVTVVSGMAEGIDSSAHTGALESGGKTIAVWGCSLDHIYPPSNKGLAEKIRENGTIYSEYLPGTRPDRAFFPERNRIIAGLSCGVVVVEAGERSGALITVEHAIQQGREIFAVPGPPGAKMSIGTNRLLKKGAALITSVDDIFTELPTLKGDILVKKIVRMPDMTETERCIVSTFTNGPLQIDQISRATSISMPELSQLLLALELKGVVTELSGKRFILSEKFTC